MTWKFFNCVLVHLDIKEGPKAANSIVASKLYIGILVYYIISLLYFIYIFIGKEIFDSLDEIIDKYIIPSNQLMKSIVSHKKFIPGDLDYSKTMLEEDKRNDPRHIPYYFVCSEVAPQYIILCYLPKVDDFIKEYIKVKPNGLYFHNYCFISLNMLIGWFKENFKTSE